MIGPTSTAGETAVLVRKENAMRSHSHCSKTTSSRGSQLLLLSQCTWYDCFEPINLVSLSIRYGPSKPDSRAKPNQVYIAGRPLLDGTSVEIDQRETIRVTAVTESQIGGFLALALVDCRFVLLERRKGVKSSTVSPSLSLGFDSNTTIECGSYCPHPRNLENHT